MQKKLLWPVFIFCCCGYNALAQECRDMNEKEKLVFQKFSIVLDSCITYKLEDAAWKLNGNTYPKNISIAISPLPARPLQFCQHIYTATLQLQPGSSSYTMLKDSADYYMNLSSKADAATMLKCIKKSVAFSNAMQFSVSVAENIPNYYLQEPGSGKIVDHYKMLQVDGAALSFQIWYKGESKDDEEKQQTVLCFGKWKNNLVKNSTNRWYYPYQFLHTAGTPFIENIVVTIDADANTAATIIKKINWAKVNGALTD